MAQKTYRTWVVLADMRTAEDVKEALYNLPVKKALIAAYMQYHGDYNWTKYPKDIEGIVKSKEIKGRYYLPITEDIVLRAQED